MFTGQRNEGFYVDLGSIFDLGDLRPFQHLHLIPSADAPGVDGTRGASVHTIAIQVPKRMLTRDGSNPTDPGAAKSVIGVWASAYRRKSLVRDDNGHVVESGPWTQVSRLGNPLFNEVVVPMSRKDEWNAVPPSGDAGFQQYVLQPELAKLLPVLYPGVFPNLAGLHADRADLAAILLTGIPSGLIPGFQNFTGAAPADMLRLNMAIPPAKHPKIYGLLDGDIAGYPNGRRPTDDVDGHRAARHRGRDLPAGGPELHAGRSGRGDHGRDDAEEQPGQVPAAVPVHGRADQRVRHRPAEVGLGERRWGTVTSTLVPPRASPWTSGPGWAPSSCTRRVGGSVARSR